MCVVYRTEESSCCIRRMPEWMAVPECPLLASIPASNPAFISSWRAPTRSRKLIFWVGWWRKLRGATMPVQHPEIVGSPLWRRTSQTYIRSKHEQANTVNEVNIIYELDTHIFNTIILICNWESLNRYLTEVLQGHIQTTNQPSVWEKKSQTNSRTMYRNCLW